MMKPTDKNKADAGENWELHVTSGSFSIKIFSIIILAQ